MSTYSASRAQEERFVAHGNNSDTELLARMTETYTEASTIVQTYWYEATVDSRFDAGDQTLWNEIYTNIPYFKRKMFNFNKIKRVINMVSGHQRRNRKSTICIPQESSDQDTSDQFSELLMWANNSMEGSHILSDAFRGSLVTGMNLLSLYMDYRYDPISGDIKCCNTKYNGYIVDPFMSKQDLSDCNYIHTKRYLDRKQIISLLPKYSSEIEKMSSYSGKDNTFNYLPQNFNFASSNMLSYEEYWYLDSRLQDLLIDKKTGDTMEWSGNKDNLKSFLYHNPQVYHTKITIPTTKMAVVVNSSNVMYHGPNPYNIDRYPFVPVMCYFNPELPYFEWRIQGMVRSMRDAQFLYNRRKQIELDILESQVTSGMKVMEGSLIDDRDAFKSGQGQAIFIKKDAPLGMESVQQMVAPQVPPSMIELSNILNKEMTEISGVNEELLGSADDDKAGILSMLRQGAGLTTLQILFDQLDLSQKMMGQIMMEMIQKNFSEGKIKRILNKEPTQEFYNKAFGKYDCQIVEGNDTATQKQMSLKQALYLREIGVPIPDDFLLEMTTLQNKNELVKSLKASQYQAQQMQQQQQQLQMMEIQAQINLANARAIADKGLGIERLSRIEENKALAQERRAKTIVDIETASLDQIKAAKELTDIDLNQLIKAVDLIERLQQRITKKPEELLEGNQNEERKMQQNIKSSQAPQGGQQDMG